MSAFTIILRFATRMLIAVATVAALASTPLLAQTNNLDMATAKQGTAKPSAIPGLKPRYLVTEMRSLESAAGNVTTSIRITNMAGKACSYAIEFYYSQGSPPPSQLACTIDAPDIRKFNTVFACSRNLTSGLATSCGLTCDPELTGVAGKAIIYSQNEPGCERIAVNATIVNSSSDDTVMVTMRNPKIVKYDRVESNKSNKGD